MQVANVAKEIAKFAKLDGIADVDDADAVFSCLVQMAHTKAEDAHDVLALLAIARTLLNTLGVEGVDAETNLQAAQAFIRNAIGAMERLSGEREATYTGREWQ